MMRFIVILTLFRLNAATCFAEVSEAQKAEDRRSILRKIPVHELAGMAATNPDDVTWKPDAEAADEIRSRSNAAEELVVFIENSWRKGGLNPVLAAFNVLATLVAPTPDQDARLRKLIDAYWRRYKLARESREPHAYQQDLFGIVNYL